MLRLCVVAAHMITAATPELEGHGRDHGRDGCEEVGGVSFVL